MAGDGARVLRAVSPAQLTRATRAQAANNCGEDRIAYEFVSQARPTPAYCRDTGRGNSREGGAVGWGPSEAAGGCCPLSIVLST